MKWYIKDTQKRLAVAKEESEELKAKRKEALEEDKRIDSAFGDMRVSQRRLEAELKELQVTGSDVRTSAPCSTLTGCTYDTDRSHNGRRSSNSC